MIKQIHRICSWGDLYYSNKDNKIELLKQDLLDLHSNVNNDITFRDALYICGQWIIISTLIEYYSEWKMTASVDQYLSAMAWMWFSDTHIVWQKLVDAILDSRYTKVLDSEWNIIEWENFIPMSFEFLENEIKKILATKIDLWN